MSETKATETKEMTPLQKIAALEAEVTRLRSDAQPSEFDLKLNALVNNSSFASIGRRLEQLKRDDPTFFQAIFEQAESRPHLFFGRASHATLAMTLKKSNPDAYRKARARAVELGLLAAAPLAEPSHKRMHWR
jgi:hypothetical protein